MRIKYTTIDQEVREIDLSDAIEMKIDGGEINVTGKITIICDGQLLIEPKASNKVNITLKPF